MVSYSPYFQTHGELEHYGVKGMKWGVRKEPKVSDTEKLAARRKRETEIVDKYYGKRISKAAKKMSRADKRGNAKVAEKRRKKLEAIAQRYLDENIAINKMTLSDFKAEDIRVGAAFAKNALVLIGSTAGMVYGVSPIALISVPNERAVRFNNRAKIAVKK